MKHYRFRRGRIYCVTSLFTLIFVLYIYHKQIHLNYYKSREITDLSNDEKALLLAIDLQSIINKIPQLPVEVFLKKDSAQPINIITGDTKCSIEYPSIWKISFNNYYWQIFKTNTGINVYLFGAYYDNRFKIKQKVFVRLSAMIDRIHPPKAICQMWLDDWENPFFAPAVFRILWLKRWGNFENGELIPYLITCLIPPELGSKIPITVSLVEDVCENATNNLMILNERQKVTENPSFAVCVKGMAFHHIDISYRLIEWIELLKILGVSKIHFYELTIHPNVAKVLSYYEEKEFVQVTKLSLPGNQPNFPELIETYQKFMVMRKRQNEIIPYNDCFYRNINSYDFITLLDIDEIILPKYKHSTTWKDMISSLKNEPFDTVCARNIYFFDKWEKENSNIPRHLHMLRHVVRSANYSGPMSYVKCLHNTSTVIAVHNHFPFACANYVKNDNMTCSFHTLSTNIAQLQHYRKHCTHNLEEKCSDFQKVTIIDETINRYAQKLIYNTDIALKNIGL